MADVLEGFAPDLVDGAARTAGDLERLGADLGRAERAVVIVGASIPGLVLAAQLSGGGARVALVTGAPPVRKRLVAGCSVRRSTLAVLGAALGCGAERLVARCGGAAASFSELRIRRMAERGGGAVATGRDVVWRSPRRLGLSTRHGHLLAALRAELPAHAGLTLVAGDVPREAALDGDVLPLRLAGGVAAGLALPGRRAVVLNATPHATLLRPGRELPPPERWVVAVQSPMRPSGPLAHPDDAAIAPTLSPASHLAFYTPFVDPDTPEATWYGINTLVVRERRDDDVQAVRARLLDMGRALGLEAAGGDAARGEAIVPVVDDTGRQTQARLDDGRRIVDVGRAFSSGAPAINVDGMLAGALGATAFATAFLAAPEWPHAAATAALDAADDALAPVRWRNRASERFFFHAPDALRRALLAAVPALAARAFTEDFADLGT